MIRFLLQAKIVEIDETYHELDKEADKTKKKQYDVFASYSKTVNAKSFYVMYNGIKDFTCRGKDCVGDYDEKQLGCTIVSVQRN